MPASLLDGDTPKQFLVISPFFDQEAELAQRIRQRWPKCQIEIVVQQKTTNLPLAALKKLGSGIASPRIDRLYDLARDNGALGGKISGAGGGGFFLFYAEEGKKELRRAMQAEGLREMRFRVDFEGSKILMDLLSGEQYRDHAARLIADAGTAC